MVRTRGPRSARRRAEPTRRMIRWVRPGVTLRPERARAASATAIGRSRGAQTPATRIKGRGAPRDAHRARSILHRRVRHCRSRALPPARARATTEARAVCVSSKCLLHTASMEELFLSATPKMSASMSSARAWAASSACRTRAARLRTQTRVSQASTSTSACSATRRLWHRSRLAPRRHRLR